MTDTRQLIRIRDAILNALTVQQARRKQYDGFGLYCAETALGVKDQRP